MNQARFKTLTLDRDCKGILLLTPRISMPKIFPFLSRSIIVPGAIFLFLKNSPFLNSIYIALASLSISIFILHPVYGYHLYKVFSSFVYNFYSFAIEPFKGAISRSLSRDRKSTRLNSSHQLISYA